MESGPNNATAISECYREINVSDNVQFHCIVDALTKYAGKKYSIWRTASWPQNYQGAEFRFWFPKIAHLGRNGNWVSPDGSCINTHNEDWSEFVFKDISGRDLSDNYDFDGISLIFAKEHKGEYVFRGAFILDREKTALPNFVYKRIGTKAIIFGKPASRIEIPDLLDQEIDSIEKNIETVSDVGDEREAIIRCRVNQSAFRTKLIKRYKCKCSICGVNGAEYLIASHIKPWCDCTPTEKLDVDNGLLLCPNHDKLFDKGYISFDEEGQIMISPQLNSNNQMFLNVKPSMRVTYTGNNDMYMEYHRTKKFKK